MPLSEVCMFRLYGACQIIGMSFWCSWENDSSSSQLIQPMKHNEVYQPNFWVVQLSICGREKKRRKVRSQVFVWRQVRTDALSQFGLYPRAWGGRQQLFGEARWQRADFCTLRQPHHLDSYYHQSLFATGFSISPSMIVQ